MFNWFKKKQPPAVVEKKYKIEDYTREELLTTRKYSILNTLNIDLYLQLDDEVYKFMCGGYRDEPMIYWCESIRRLETIEGAVQKDSVTGVDESGKSLTIKREYITGAILIETSRVPVTLKMQRVVEDV